MEPTKQQIQQDQIDNFNKTDVRTKEWRDQNTSTHSFVADINHTLEEMGQRGFSFSKMNSLMGGQIAQHARTIGDRRYLGLLDEIQTPGGSWGNTQEGLKLKQVTWVQIDADENRKVRNERAARLETKDKLVDVLKAELGLLVNKLRSAKPNDKPSIQKKIDELLSGARASGLGTEIHGYHNNIVDGMAKGTAGGAVVIKGLHDVANPDLHPTMTMRDFLVESLKNNLSDVSKDQRKQIVNSALNGTFASLDKDGQADALKMVTDFKAVEATEEYIAAENHLKQLIKNKTVEYTRATGQSLEAQLKAALGGQSSAIPNKLLKLIAKHTKLFKAKYREEFSAFSDTLEKHPEDEAAYGYNGWSPKHKEEFNKVYKEKIEPLLEEFNTELEAFKEADKPRVEEEETHEEKYRALKNSTAPKHYIELHDMLYPAPTKGQTYIKPSNLLERFKIAVVGLQVGATASQKEVADFHTSPSWNAIKNLELVSDDVLSWFEKSVGDSRDPVVINEKLKQLWEWGLYVIQRQEHLRINDLNISPEAKLKRIKIYDESVKLEKYPKSVKALTGASKIIEEVKHDGYIDIVLIYKKALTIQEVQQNYNVLKRRFQ